MPKPKVRAQNCGEKKTFSKRMRKECANNAKYSPQKGRNVHTAFYLDCRMIKDAVAQLREKTFNTGSFYAQEDRDVLSMGRAMTRSWWGVTLGLVLGSNLPSECLSS